MKREISKEKNFIQDDRTGSKSSFKALFFQDLPPELLRRIAKRYTDGHLKYGQGVFNLNWRTGLDNPEYVAERFNHLWTHLINFLENGNEFDDNLAAIVWSCSLLMEVERLYPEVLKQVIGQCNLSGEEARKFVKKHPETK